MAKLSLTDISAGYLSIATYNANNTLLETALENTLSRDGTTPNTMSANLDLNSQKAVNAADGTNNQDYVTLAQLNAASVVASTIAGTAVTIADAGGYYVATTAEAALQELWVTLASSSNGDGASLIGVEDAAADFTATTVEGVLTELQANIDALGGSLSNVVEDTTPQLGGDLDLNSNDITGTGTVVTDNASASEPGFKGIPQNDQNGNYTLLLTDAGKRIYKASGGAGETYTIPANASVAFGIGTAIEFVNDGGGDLTIAITTDTLEKFGGSTGSQTLGDNQKATIEKVTATLWKYSSTD